MITEASALLHKPVRKVYDSIADQQRDLISCHCDGRNYTCAKSRPQDLTSHINNVYAVLGRVYEADSPVNSLRLDRPESMEIVRRMRVKEHPERSTSISKTGDHVERNDQEEEEMDHSNSDSKWLTVLSDRIDRMNNGMNNRSSAESRELGKPLF
ncbi:hypothetical protein CHS0354_033257 [Potamilus streckersoni]|uniref:Uncharacterized protein n=1 Tax=Potamilus streckersoni TaxID=2493646 RepID=A0AAE0S6Y0_9BIVA|nr:hypothetical protein CHS0354_033257 [Potamilus streckersoni]